MHCVEEVSGDTWGRSPQGERGQKCGRPTTKTPDQCVALRKESVDRNVDPDKDSLTDDVVALRKESVDRNGRPIDVQLIK